MVTILAVSLAVVSALLAISEVLSFIPSVKANGNIQAIVNGLKALRESLLKLVEKP